MKFIPYPEHAEVVDSFDEVITDKHDPAEDGDDTLVPSESPGILGRLTQKLKTK
jgi:hypothetical protein